MTLAAVWFTCTRSHRAIECVPSTSLKLACVTLAIFMLCFLVVILARTNNKEQQ